VPRPKVLRRLWAQLAALGVGRLILTNAARVERNYFDSHVLDEQIYRPLLIEGLQQARDTRVPIVSVHRQFRKLVEDELDTLCPQHVRLVADPGDAESPRDAARAAMDSRVLLAIGPEGGWNAFELELLRARGFERVSIGSRTLRTDTACVALLSLVHDGLAARATP
jgi:RsmE family RNA methyltransferase